MSNKLSKHDNFFAKCLENHDIAKSLFKKYFPPSVQNYIHWDTAKLKQLNTKFVDDAGHRYVLCDVLYQVTNDNNKYDKDKTAKNNRANKNALIIFHLEHQTSPDKTMAFRTIYYAMGAMKQYHEQHPEKPFPPVLSLIYYQNKKPYTHSLDLRDLLDKNVPDAIRDLFLKPILINSADNTDEELKTHGDASHFEIILKHRVEKSSIKNEHILGNAASKMTGSLRRIALEYSIRGSTLDEELTNEIYSTYFDPEEMMTYEQRLIQKGANATLEQVAKNLLSEKLAPDFIAKNTGLDLKKIEEIKKSLH